MPIGAAAMFRHEMNLISGAIVRWLERKRRTDRASAAAISVIALTGGLALFLLASFLIYAVLSLFCGVIMRSELLLRLVALALTAWAFACTINRYRVERDTVLDPMGFWILRDIWSIGPRLVLEGSRQVRCWALLGELDVPACARALSYLASQNKAVTWQDLVWHCPDLPWPRLREQLSLLNGVLFLGEDAARVTLMGPFRLRLRWMLRQEQGEEPVRPKPEAAPKAAMAKEPEKLSPYEILGLSPSASLKEIKSAYRKRMKECHPDLFAGMDEPARTLAERWARALNAAYATLNPRQGSARRTSNERA